ncbi:hypothetical protein BU52_30775 [Streptomyces toyocaensis]|uniref:Nucleotidyltransferase n=1 Tax=Streptomyces toyocaensis TaxID=55952 RepID=A0A081XIQ1_STRTO|nr:hypothetical protein [Streptomyces toyocaensis]KES03424.1 hypothetical protein BU52_30775 [Streptomyces toyocaensis]
MSQAPAGVDEDELNQAARSALLDALVALENHRDATTVVGAQAVYLRTQNATIRSAPYTADGDISIDPQRLGENPLIEQAMRGAGFSLRDHQSGLWERPQQVGALTVPVEVDLLVPHQLAPRPNTKRRTELPPHNEWATKKVAGLEVAAVDRSIMTVTSLTPGDARQVDAYVAGPAALLVAKAIKIDERIKDAAKRPDRLSNKDAGDVYRIMTTALADDLAQRFAELSTDPRVGDTAQQGLKLLRTLFGAAATPGTNLAVQALAGDVPADRIRGLMPAFVDALSP